MRLCDYVIDFLVLHDITDLFLVSGGGIAHLLDSVGRNPAMRYYCNYHEQACAIAAEGYARVTGRVGACLVTLGPGAANALSGIMGAWVDSIPLLVLSGQVRSDLIADYGKIRQMGPQEANVLEMARPVTKYAVSVRDPSRIRYELEKALHIATSGRPGPVWVEIPFNVQGANIDEAVLQGYEPDRPAIDAQALDEDVAQVSELIRAAQRPLVIAGNGIHLSGTRKLFLRFIERWQLPVVVPYSAKDILPEAHPNYVGVFGTNGQRRANFAVQNSDLLLSLGAGLCVSKVGFNYKGFAPKAKKIIVDIDPGQVQHQVLEPELPLIADLRRFLPALLQKASNLSYRPSARWLEACALWKRRYPVITPEFLKERSAANMYVFMDRLADVLSKGELVVTGNGFDAVSCYQAFKVKEGQRVIISGNWGSMGWDLPLAIGGCIGRGRGRTIVACGDGSVQWNIQELLTIRQHRLPIKIFVFNNNGYSSIRATQNSLFEGRLVGADPSSGVGGVDFEKLASLYGFEFVRIENNEQILAGVRAALAAEGPVLCEVLMSPEQNISPKASAFRRPDGTLESRPLEDMAPFLPRQEVHRNMHLFDDGAAGPIEDDTLVAAN